MSSPQSRLIDDANTTREFDTTLRPPKSSADDDVTGVAGESKLDILLDLLSDEETTGPPPAPPGLRNEEGKLDVTKVIQYFERRGVRCSACSFHTNSGQSCRVLGHRLRLGPRE
jgi:hypothetical protein